jgi:hypothetical protein
VTDRRSVAPLAISSEDTIYTAAGGNLLSVPREKRLLIMWKPSKYYN